MPCRAPIDRRQNVRLARHRRRLHVNCPTAEETAQPRAIGQPRCPGPSVQRHIHVAFQVRDDLALPGFDNGGAVDPQHGLVAVGEGFALLDHAIAAQDPDLEGAGLPAIARLGGNADRLGRVQRRQLHLGSGGSGEEGIAKCKMKIERCKLARAICVLHAPLRAQIFRACAAPSLHNRSGPVARQVVSAEEHPCFTGLPQFVRPSDSSSQNQPRKVVARKTRYFKRRDYTETRPADQGGLEAIANDITPYIPITSRGRARNPSAWFKPGQHSGDESVENGLRPVPWF